MKSINLGHVTVIADPSLRVRAMPYKPQSAKVQPHLILQPISPNGARETVGFEVLQPRWLPTAQLKLANAHQRIVTSSSSHQVLGAILKYRAEGGPWLVIEQTLIERILRIQIPFEVWEGKVLGHPAVFYTYTVEASDQQNGRISILHSLWENGVFLMELQGSRISLEDMIKVGEFLA